MSAVLHGWTGILMGYAAVQGPMIAGLMRARASFQHYAVSPMVAAPLTAVAAAGAAMLGSHGPLQVAVAAGMSALLG
jgi:hypothetical protein